MELENEVTLDGTIYCFENFSRAAEAKAWIADNIRDLSTFRVAFPDGERVNTDPLGLGDLDNV